MQFFDRLWSAIRSKKKDHVTWETLNRSNPRLMTNEEIDHALVYVWKHATGAQGATAVGDHLVAEKNSRSIKRLSYLSLGFSVLAICIAAGSTAVNWVGEREWQRAQIAQLSTIHRALEHLDHFRLGKSF